MLAASSTCGSSADPSILHSRAGSNPDNLMGAGVSNGHGPTSADHVRRSHVSPESPTPGLSHLQFEAMLTAARDSDRPDDFALVAMLGLFGLLGLRISEARRC